MARIRTIKPEFFTSEDIVELSPMARLLYIAVWCEADKEGRLVWKPKTLKIRYFPADSCNIEKLCSELLERGLVVLYGDGLAYIPSFKEHQHINPRETESKLPEPDASSTRELRVITCANQELTDREEGKGREGKDKARGTRKTPLPENFTVSENVRVWASEHGYAQLERHLAHFIDTAKAKGYTYADWDAAFRNAIKGNWAKLPEKTSPLEPGADPNEIVTLPDGRKLPRHVVEFQRRMMQ